MAMQEPTSTTVAPKSGSASSSTAIGPSTSIGLRKPESFSRTSSWRRTR